MTLTVTLIPSSGAMIRAFQGSPRYRDGELEDTESHRMLVLRHQAPPHAGSPHAGPPHADPGAPGSSCTSLYQRFVLPISLCMLLLAARLNRIVITLIVITLTQNQMQHWKPYHTSNPKRMKLVLLLSQFLIPLPRIRILSLNPSLHMSLALCRALTLVHKLWQWH